ncbi:MAG: hypothetical protein ACTSSH_11195 [Candidatus Heimdallarchaeota archaeon]
MSTAEIPKTKPERFSGWKQYPFEIKVMDLSIIAWLALIIVNVVLTLVGIELSIRSFAAFFFPILMFGLTIALRLRLFEKPDTIRNTFVVWTILFVFFFIITVLVLIFYPGIIGLS